MKKKRILFLILTLFMTYLQASALEYVENIKVGDYLSLRPNITTYGRSYSWSYEGGDKNLRMINLNRFLFHLVASILMLMLLPAFPHL